MFCLKCGEKLEKTIVFCPKCGTKVVANASSIGQSNDQVSNSPVQSATDISKLIMIVAGIILSGAGVGLIIYGITLYNSLSSQLKSLFSRDSTNPGTVYIVSGIVILVGGAILLIIGLLKKPNNLSNNNVVNTGIKPSNNFAIVGLVLGSLSVLSFTVLGIPCGITGIVLSIIGRSKLKLSGGSTKIATIGLVLSIVGLAISLLFVIGMLYSRYQYY